MHLVLGGLKMQDRKIRKLMSKIKDQNEKCSILEDAERDENARLENAGPAA